MNRWTKKMLLAFGITSVMLIVKHVIATVRGPRIVVAIGDSLTANGGYCNKLAEELPQGSEVTCIGYEGHGVTTILNNMNHVLAKKPTDVIVLVGVNDIASGRSEKSITNDLNDIYSSVKGMNARLIAVELTPWAGHRKGKNLQNKTSNINNFIRQHNAPDKVVSTSSLGNMQKELLVAFSTGDGLHLSRDGQSYLGDLIMSQAF